MSNLYNHSLEQSIISTLISTDNSYQKVAGKIKANDFYSEAHQLIFESVESLVASGKPYDTVMIIDKLLADKRNKSVIEYMNELLIAASSIFNIESYIERLIDLSQRRKISECYERAKLKIANFDLAPIDSWSLTAEDVNTVMQGTVSEGYSSIDQLIENFVEDLKHNATVGVAPNIKTGLVELDNKTMIMNGEMVVIAARPSMGKTTLGQTIAINISQNEDGVVVFFSLEMPKASIVKRLVSSMANIHMSKVFSGQNLNTQDWEGIMSNKKRIEALPMIIDDRSGITTGQMRATLNRIRQKHGRISAILVDYIQLIRANNLKDNREGQIRDISSALKGFAKEFDCPMLALSQLNRSLENRDNKRPIMSDLRDSGSIEQDADHIIFVYRDEVYNEKSVQKGIAELIIGKQRNGSIGTVKAKFEGEYSRFADLA
ncbi:replicative DNA helicase [Psychrobacter sp. Arc9]|uniref:replicative DNA helicase n=1 Tax=Psychrobacter sp. Arc9 TaxID=3046687 RepID=UPI00352F9311|tara:strand:- start:2031 stop:3329 length:1299 start_codon:yes stop_codon:yes gene_type:complete